MTSVLLTGPAVLPVLSLAKFSFDILVLRKDPCCIILLSVMPVDAAQKMMMKFGWLGAEIWEFYSRRYFRQDITLVKLSISIWLQSQRSQVQTLVPPWFLNFLFIINSNKKKDWNINKNPCENHNNCGREQRTILLLFVNVNKAHYPYFLIRCLLQSWLWMSGVVTMYKVCEGSWDDPLNDLMWKSRLNELVEGGGKKGSDTFLFTNSISR